VAGGVPVALSYGAALAERGNLQNGVSPLLMLAFNKKLQISEKIKKDARENLLALEEQSRPSHFCESRLGLVECRAAFSA
jgi:hypothetical protein